MERSLEEVRNDAIAEAGLEYDELVEKAHTEYHHAIAQYKTRYNAAVEAALKTYAEATAESASSGVAHRSDLSESVKQEG